MNKKVKEPFFLSRVLNMILGIIILALIIVVIMKDTGTEIYEMLIFALAAAENFIAATICFLQQKMVRGNMFAVFCAVFLIVAIFLAVRYFVFV